MVRKPKKRRLLATFLALAALAATCALAVAQRPKSDAPTSAFGDGNDPIPFSRNVAGDSKPIQLSADDVVTWIEGKQRIVLLQGRVLIQQGIVQGRCQQAVAWVDLDRLQRTKVLHVDVYAEGDVRVESGSEGRTGPRATLDLNTRGEFKLNAARNKIVQEARRDDPVYLRGLTLQSSQSGVRRTGAEEVAPPPPVPTPTPTPAGPPSGAAGPAPRFVPVQGGPPAGLTPARPRPSRIPTAPSRPGLARRRGVVPPVLPGPAPGPRPPQPGGPAPGEPEFAVPMPEAAPPPRTVPGPPGDGQPGPPPAPAPPAAPPRLFSIAPRTSADFQSQIVNLPEGGQALVVTGGVILTVRNGDKLGLIDMEADRVVIWSNGPGQTLLENLRRPEGGASRELEVYLAGNVEVREQPAPRIPLPGMPPPPPMKTFGPRTLRADEVYYDVGRNVAVALKADLEVVQPGLPEPLHFRGVEIRQLSPSQFQGFKARVFSSRMPADPRLQLYATDAFLEEKKVPRRRFFFFTERDPKTGEVLTEEESLVTAHNVFFEAWDTPFFWLPYTKFDARDPLGPLENFNIGYNKIYGFQTGVSLDVYDLFGLDKAPNTKWRLDLDYLGRRGPGLGTEYDARTTQWFGLPAKADFKLLAWGLSDKATDILGGTRGDLPHPDLRGRVFLRDMVNELPEGFSIQGQLSALSDKNFLEEYYYREFTNDPNQETFLYVKQQQGDFAWTVLGEAYIRNWVTETEWLPKVDGYALGIPLWDQLTYSAHASAGYGRLRTTDVPPPPLSPTDQTTSTGRFDLTQELSYPFQAGAVRLVPYGVFDLTYYTEDLKGTDVGRVYGGGGVRASIPFTRLYPDVASDLLNLEALNHKIVLTGNYFLAGSTVSYKDLPQLDRINDDATDQARRDLRPDAPFLYAPNVAPILANSPLYDPQVYAFRRMVEDRIDTRDDIQEVQLDLNQRLQTKRGFPGQEHIVDWMMLDTSMTIFPAANRDNFGETFEFLEYDYLWNIGDRTALVSNGWFDPIDNGARYWSVGGFFDRPDRTGLYLGYRQIDPVGSRAVTGSVGYSFSAKYSMLGSSTYDFGTNQSLSNMFVLTRTGTDLSVSIGLTYNATTNNFGFLFQILPNVLGSSRYANTVQTLTGPGGIAGR